MTGDMTENDKMFYSQHFIGLRWILLNILWQSLPAEASDKWQNEQMQKAGATRIEIERLRAQP